MIGAHFVCEDFTGRCAFVNQSEQNLRDVMSDFKKMSGSWNGNIALDVWLRIRSAYGEF